MKNQIVSILISIIVPILIIGAIIYFFVDNIKSFFNRDANSSTSTDIDVDSSIQLINASFDRFGTDFSLFLRAFKSLSKIQIDKLFVDFGTRYYNKLTGMYSKFQILEGVFISKKMKLKEIIIEELTDEEFGIFISMLKSKGVTF